ncbi:MAG: DDE-type integrase/transposase/recombinase [Thermoplasmata archaeon]
MLRGRGRKGWPILFSALYTTNREDEHAESLLKQAKGRARKLPNATVSDGEHSFKRAYYKLFYQRHRRKVKLVHGVPIACRKHGLKHNNNPAEQMVDELKDWYRHMNGLSSDKSAVDLVRGWFMHENFVDTLSCQDTGGEGWTGHRTTYGREI